MHPLLILPPPISQSLQPCSANVLHLHRSLSSSHYYTPSVAQLSMTDFHLGLPCFGLCALVFVNTAARKYPRFFKGLRPYTAANAPHLRRPHRAAISPAPIAQRPAPLWAASVQKVLTHFPAFCLFAPAFWRPTNLTPERKQSLHESTHPPQGNPGPRHQPHGPLGPGSGRPCRRRPVHHPPPHRKRRAHPPHHLGF